MFNVNYEALKSGDLPTFKPESSSVGGGDALTSSNSQAGLAGAKRRAAKHFLQWSVADVETWLRCNVHLDEKMVQRFANAEIDGEVLPTLSDADLLGDDLGMSNEQLDNFRRHFGALQDIRGQRTANVALAGEPTSDTAATDDNFDAHRVPHITWVCIFSHLSFSSRYPLILTCRRWRALIDGAESVQTETETDGSAGSFHTWSVARAAPPRSQRVVDAFASDADSDFHRETPLWMNLCRNTWTSVTETRSCVVHTLDSFVYASYRLARLCTALLQQTDGVDAESARTRRIAALAMCDAAERTAQHMLRSHIVIRTGQLHALLRHFCSLRYRLDASVPAVLFVSDEPFPWPTQLGDTPALLPGAQLRVRLFLSPRFALVKCTDIQAILAPTSPFGDEQAETSQLLNVKCARFDALCAAGSFAPCAALNGAEECTIRNEGGFAHQRSSAFASALTANFDSLELSAPTHDAMRVHFRCRVQLRSLATSKVTTLTLTCHSAAFRLYAPGALTLEEALLVQLRRRLGARFSAPVLANAVQQCFWRALLSPSEYRHRPLYFDDLRALLPPLADASIDEYELGALDEHLRNVVHTTVALRTVRHLSQLWRIGAVMPLQRTTEESVEFVKASGRVAPGVFLLRFSSGGVMPLKVTHVGVVTARVGDDKGVPCLKHAKVAVSDDLVEQLLACAKYDRIVVCRHEWDGFGGARSFPSERQCVALSVDSPTLRVTFRRLPKRNVLKRFWVRQLSSGDFDSVATHYDAASDTFFASSAPPHNSLENLMFQL